MKYFILATMVTLFSLNSFGLGQTSSRDCCPTGNCTGKKICPDSGNSRKAERRERRIAKKQLRKQNRDNGDGV